MLPFMFDKSDAESLSPPSFPNTPSHSRSNSHTQFPSTGRTATPPVANGNNNNTGTSTPINFHGGGNGGGPGTPHHALTHGVSSPLARSSPAPKYEPYFLFAVYRDSTTPPDPDDALHEPDLDEKGNALGHDLPRGHKLRGSAQPFVFSIRGMANILTLVIVMLGVFMLFPGYFIYSAVTRNNYFSRAGGGNLVGFVSFENLGSVTVARAGTSFLGLASGTAAAVVVETGSATVTDFGGPVTETDTDTGTDVGAVPTTTVDTDTPGVVPTPTPPTAPTPPAAAPVAPPATPTQTDTGDDDGGDGSGNGNGGPGNGGVARRRRRRSPVPLITPFPSS